MLHVIGSLFKSKSIRGDLTLLSLMPTDEDVRRGIPQYKGIHACTVGVIALSCTNKPISEIKRQVTSTLKILS